MTTPGETPIPFLTVVSFRSSSPMKSSIPTDRTTVMTAAPSHFPEFLRNQPRKGLHRLFRAGALCTTRQPAPPGTKQGQDAQDAPPVDLDSVLLQEDPR